MSDGIVLPSGYTRLEYIEQPLGNSGYIKSGIFPSNDLDFEIKAVTYDTITNTVAQIGCLFGSRTSATYEYQLTTYIDSGATNKGTLRIGQTVYDANLTKNELFHALTSGNVYHHNNTEIQTVRDFNDENPAELYIFCFNVGDGGTDRPRQFGHGKIYYLKFFTGSTLIRDYIPCKNPNGVVGLYDLVTSSFFSSEDTAFVAGPVVTARTIGISQKLIELQEIKEDLRSAINDYYNNEELTYSDGLVEYPDAIDGITVTSSLPTEPKVVNFIDYDGTLLYAYTAQEFRASEGLPHNPFHSGLVAQGWNWTREEILDYLTRAERIDVGQMYITNNGATRYYIHKTDPDYLTQTLVFYQGVANGVLVNWGDNTSERFTGTGTKTVTHTYNSTGDYVISLLPDDDCTFQLTGRADSYTSYTASDNTVFGTYYSTAGVYILKQECYKVELGKGLTGISACAFRYFQNLETISVPKNIGTLGPGCFYLCFGLKCFVCPRNTNHPLMLEGGSLRSLRSLKYICTSPVWAVSYLGDNCFRESLMEYILLPDACTSIKSSAFYACTKLKTLYLSKNVTALPSECFRGSYGLKTIDLSNITSYGSNCLYGLTSLQAIKFPEGTTSLPNSMAYDCHSLFEIDLPSTVTTIGTQAFNSCFNVRRIIVRATTPPTLTNVNAFHGAYVTNSGADYRGTSTGMGHFYVPYSADHSVLQAYLDSDATSSWGYYLTFDCAITELNADGTIPEEDWV